jgi:hypothetical protein
MKPLPLAFAALAVSALAVGALPARSEDWLGEGARKNRHLQGEDQGSVAIVPRVTGKQNGDHVLARICSEGTGPLDDMLRLIGERVTFSDAQVPLFDAFRDAARTAQADYVATCMTTQPSAAWVEELDLAARLRIRITVESARTSALNAVMPAFEALYRSLDDAQKALLEPGQPVSGGGPNAAIEPHAPRGTGLYDI